jgi:hypothetical protein
VTQDNLAIVNTISTTSGAALSVKDTEIGAAGLTFRSISAGTTSYTSGVGIVLENTGTAPQNGGLTVTGNGTAQSGGIIRRKTGADGATNAGIGIYLNATKNASFSWMDLNRLDNSGIAGRNVSGFLLANSVINGAGTTPGIAEGPVVFGLPVGVDGLQGAGIIRNSQIFAGVDDNVAVYNHSGSMSLLIESTAASVADCTIGPNSTTTGGRGLVVQTDGNAVASVTVNRCRIRNNRVAGILAAGSGDSNLTLVLTGSPTDAALKSQVLRSASGGQGQDGIVVTNADDADVTATVENTVFSGLLGAGVWVGQAAGNASALSMLRATITANRIDSPAGPGSTGVVARFSSRPGEVAHARLLVANNSTPISAGLNQYGALPAIAISTPDAGTSPAADVTLIGNHVDMRESAPGSGTRGPVGVSVVGTQGSLCANIQSTISHFYPVDTAPQGGGLRLERGGAGIVQLEGGTQPAGSAAGATLAANNPAPGSSTMITEAIGAVDVIANDTCQPPSAP